MTVMRAALYALGLVCLLAGPAPADTAYYLSSFGDGVPSVRWWVLSADGETLTLSDGGLVRDYALDGTPLARRFMRDPPRGELIAVEAAPSGDLYLLVHGDFDPPVGEGVPVVERWSPEGLPLGAVGAIGTGPGEFQDANDLAIAPDGSVLVADLGNSRIQRFSQDLEFLGAWPASESPLSRGFLGPTHIAVDQESRVWTCYLPGSVSSVDYPIEVVIYDLNGNELHSFGTTVELSHSPPHWGDVLLSMGADSSDSVHFFCATAWSERLIASFGMDGLPIAQFPVSGYATSASFAPDGRAVVQGYGVGVEVFSADGVSLHHWGDAVWAFENSLPSSPQDIEFDAQGHLVVSGGEDLSTESLGYSYIHRYGLDGSLQEVVVSALASWEDPSPSFYFALGLDGAPVASWCPAVSDSEGNFYYLVDFSPAIVRKTSSTGEIIAEWTFGRVTAIDIGLDGLLYDLNHNSYGYWVEVRDLDGNLLRSFDVAGNAPIAADPEGRVWVGRSLYAANGEYIGTTPWAGIEEFWPSAIAVSQDGLVAFACEQENRVHLFSLTPLLFSDVAGAHWAFWEVDACTSADIVSGYPDGLYHPGLAVARDQMAAYISRALAGGDDNVPAGPAEPTFADVPPTYWAYDYVEHCAAQAVVEGVSPRYYRPGLSVDRAQMAVYIARALVAPEGEAGLADYVPADPRDFPDVPSDFWAYLHIEYCVEHGVVAGYADGLYRPQLVVTRDQMAVYVARAFGLTM